MGSKTFKLQNGHKGSMKLIHMNHFVWYAVFKPLGWLGTWHATFSEVWHLKLWSNASLCVKHVTEKKKKCKSSWNQI